MMEKEPDKFSEDSDPIVEEVRRAREALFGQFNYDLQALGEYLQKRTEEAAKAGRKVVSSLPRRPRTTPAKKVG